MIYLFLAFCSCYLHYFLFYLLYVLFFTQWMLFSVQVFFSLSLPLLLFSEWLLFHVGCPCWKNQSNVVFTLKSHCFHDYKKKPTSSCLWVIQLSPCLRFHLSASRKLLLNSVIHSVRLNMWSTSGQVFKKKHFLKTDFTKKKESDLPKLKLQNEE